MMVRNTLTLMTGTGLSALIILLCSPVLTRLYTPQEFGIFAIFVAMASIIGNVSAGRYDMAILLPKSEKMADNLLGLSFLITLGTLFLSQMIVWSFGDGLMQSINMDAMIPYLPLVPFMIAFVGLQLTLNAYCNRHEGYKILAQGKLLDAIILNICAITLGYIGWEIWGLVTGFLAGRLLSILYVGLRQKEKIIRAIIGMKRNSIARVAGRYNSFPKHSIAATLVGSLAANIHLFLFATYFGGELVGIIALATRIILNPLAIISSSFSQVYYKHLTGLSSSEELDHSYTRSAVWLGFISFMSIITVMFLPDSLFIILFGDTWGSMSAYIKILIWWFSVQFISGCLSIIFVRLEKESFIFFIQVLNLLMSSLSIFYAYKVSLTTEEALLLFSIVKVLLYIGVIVLPILYFRKNDQKNF